MMTPDRWQRLQDLFDGAIELAPDSRRAYIDQRCADDPSLARQVESLILSSEEAGDFIEGALQSVSQDVVEERATAVVGRQIGPYAIVRELGHGAMGTVYLARRADEQYESEVAIKLVRGGLAGPQTLRRFLTERQILANLSHPNIARLLDGGTTPDGVPYVVMEYVDGLPIDEFCDQRCLTIRERLELFRGVCRAVQYAHRNLVVHRDLKPSNILVTRDGVPKLLDFGIAKLLDPGDVPHTVLQTASSMRLMTPSYASPEQVRGETISVAADVYALGAVLYELLSGHVPHKFERFTHQEFERVICEVVPERPSDICARDVQSPRADGEVTTKRSAEETARDRATTVDRLCRHLSGDLDNVVLTAMKKEPDRRYESVDRFDDDLGRHLGGLPVAALKDSRTYRIAKFVRRHRVAVAVVTAFIVLLTGFAATMTVQAARLAEQRDAAEQRRITADRVSQFMIDLFEVADPNESEGNSVTAREILDQGAERVDAELQGQPAIQATLMDVIGRVYQNLGLFGDAEPLLVQSLETRRTELGEEHPDVAASLNSLGSFKYVVGEYEDAEPYYREALALRRKLGVERAYVAETLDGLASVLDESGRLEEAEQYYREALAIDREEGDSVLLAAAFTNLGGVLRRMGRYAEAESLLVEGLAIRRQVLGNDDLDVAHSLNQLARLKTLQGDNAAALPLAREGLAIRRQAYGEPHPEIAASLGNVSGILAGIEDHGGAEAARRESLSILRELFGNDHPYVAGTVNSLADLMVAKGDLPAAETAYREALALHRDVLPTDHPNIGYPLTGLGRVLVESHRPDEAEPFLREAHRIRNAGLPEGHWHTAASASALGECLVALGRFNDAEPLLIESYETLRDTFGEADRRTNLGRDRVIALYVAWGKPGLAEEYRAAMGTPVR